MPFYLYCAPCAEPQPEIMTSTSLEASDSRENENGDTRIAEEYGPKIGRKGDPRMVCEMWTRKLIAQAKVFLNICNCFHAVVCHKPPSIGKSSSSRAKIA